MSSPFPSRRWWGARLRSVVTVVLTATATSYVLFGNELVSRVGTVFDRAWRSASNATKNLQTRAEADRLDQARTALGKLLACRESLAEQVKSLRDHRAAVAHRLDQDSAMLRRVLAAREVGSSPDLIDRDTDVLRRVQSGEDELAKCDTELQHLTESLDQLDRSIDQAVLVVQQQSDELERRKMGAAGRRAIEDGRDITSQIIKLGH